MTELANLHHTVGSIDAKVDILLERTRGFDTRLRTVEKRQWWQSGASAVVGFFAATFLKGHI